MKTYKKFKIHLVNGREVVFPSKKKITIQNFHEDCWNTVASVSIFDMGDGPIVPWHGVAMIEGVEDEGKE